MRNQIESSCRRVEQPQIPVAEVKKLQDLRQRGLVNISGVMGQRQNLGHRRQA